MAVTVTSGAGRNALYTGLVRAKIICVNPTLDELQNKLDIPAEKVPEYVKTKLVTVGSQQQQIAAVRLEFHFETVKSDFSDAGIKARLSIFTSYQPVSTGQKINNFGKFSKKSPQEDPQFYASTWQLPAYDGEMDLMFLMESLLNPMRNTNFTIDSRQQVFYYGDVAELTDMLAQGGNNTVQLMLGVQTDKDGKSYQAVYKRVMPQWMNQYDKFHKNLVESVAYSIANNSSGNTVYFGPLEEQFHPSQYALREWSPMTAQMGSAATPAATTTTAPAPPAPAPPAAPAAPALPYDPLVAATGDGWQVHPTSPAYWYRGQEVLLIADVAAKYPAPAPAAAPAPPAPANFPAPRVGGPLGAAAAAGTPRFNNLGQPVKWAPGDVISGNSDRDSPDYNPDHEDNDLPF